MAVISSLKDWLIYKLGGVSIGYAENLLDRIMELHEELGNLREKVDNVAAEYLVAENSANMYKSKLRAVKK